MRNSLFIFTELLVLAACTPISVIRPESSTLAAVTPSATVTPVVFEPTPVPSAVKGPEFTPTALSVQDNTFSLQDMNTVLPEDIIQETSYFGGMGGGGSCNLDYSSPQLENETHDVEIMHQVSFSVCGLSENENIKVSLEDPHGATKQYNISSQKDDKPQARAYFTHVPDYQDPIGSYKVIFEGNGWQLTGIMNVLDAPGPRLYRDENLLIFYKFNPNERVRLFVYDEQKLLGWKEYQMDAKGELVLTTSESVNFVALGDVSGQAVVHHKGGFTWDGVGDISCPGAPNPIKLIAYQYAEVIVDSLPAFDLTQKSSLILPRGAILEVRSHAYCENSAWFHYFFVVDAANRWVAIQDGDTTQAFLRPLAELPPTPTPDPANIPACVGPLPTRLQVGMNAQVTLSGKAPQLKLRTLPGMSAEQVHVIAAGRKMIILEGPVCADSSYWWRIRSEQGYEGWAREGDNEDYWIDPLP